jgi:hypothetical protein
VGAAWDRIGKEKYTGSSAEYKDAADLSSAREY